MPLWLYLLQQNCILAHRKMTKNLVIIPTYNEIENIEKMIRTVFGLARPFEVLIVDDGSPDGTSIKVKELQKEYPNVLHIEERKGKLGLGTAYIHGFKWALKNNYDFIFEMDCDFSHNPKDLIRLLEKKIYHEESVSVIESIMNELKQRTWQLRDFISWEKFIGGQ